MTNEDKAKEISNRISYQKDRQSVAYRAAMRMAEWKDERQKLIISVATAHLMGTLKGVGFSHEDIVKCTDELKNELIKRIA